MRRCQETHEYEILRYLWGAHFALRLEPPGKQKAGASGAVIYFTLFPSDALCMDSVVTDLIFSQF